MHRSALSARRVTEESLRTELGKRDRPSRRVGVPAQPFGLEQVPVVNRMEHDRPLYRKGHMWLADLADAGVSFHDDKRGPGLRFQVAEPQTGDCRKPKGSVVNDESHRRCMRTTVCPRGGEGAVRMTIEQRSQLVMLERIGFGPSLAKTRGCACVA